MVQHAAAAPPSDDDWLRRVLLRLAHESPDAAGPAGQASAGAASDRQAGARPELDREAAASLGLDRQTMTTGPSSDGQAAPGSAGQNAVPDSALSVLWYAASSSPIGLLFQGNAQGGGPGHVRGLSVIGVLAGSPADLAGCRAGDLIIAMDGQPVTDPAVFDRLRSGQFPGASARLRIIRDGKTQTVSIALRSALAR